MLIDFEIQTTMLLKNQDGYLRILEADDIFKCLLRFVEVYSFQCKITSSSIKVRASTSPMTVNLFKENLRKVMNELLGLSRVYIHVNRLQLSSEDVKKYNVVYMMEKVST